MIQCLSTKTTQVHCGLEPAQDLARFPADLDFRKECLHYANEQSREVFSPAAAWGIE